MKIYSVEVISEEEFEELEEEGKVLDTGNVCISCEG